MDLRLNRALRLETAQLNQRAVAILEGQGARDMSTLSAQQLRNHDSNLLMESYDRGSSTLDRIGRYESRLSREFARTLKQLQSAQDRRGTSEAVQEGNVGMSVEIQDDSTAAEPLADATPATGLPQASADLPDSSASANTTKMTKQTHQVQQNPTSRSIKQTQADHHTASS